MWQKVVLNNNNNSVYTISFDTEQLHEVGTYPHVIAHKMEAHKH